MAKGPKLKTAVVTIRLEPRLKAAAEQAARLDRRSLTNLIEVLIEERCRSLEVEIGAAEAGGQ